MNCNVNFALIMLFIGFASGYNALGEDKVSTADRVAVSFANDLFKVFPAIGKDARPDKSGDPWKVFDSNNSFTLPLAAITGIGRGDMGAYCTGILVNNILTMRGYRTEKSNAFTKTARWSSWNYEFQSWIRDNKDELKQIKGYIETGVLKEEIGGEAQFCWLQKKSSDANHRGFIVEEKKNEAKFKKFKKAQSKSDGKFTLVAVFFDKDGDEDDYLFRIWSWSKD